MTASGCRLPGVADVQDALNGIDPAALPRDEWLRIGMALKEGGHEERLWDEWSARDAERYREGECSRLWDGFADGGGVTMGTFWYICGENGAVAPSSQDDRAKQSGAAVAGTATPTAAYERAFMAHKELLATARDFLRDDPGARAQAADYLSSNVGITVDRACELGLGAFTPGMAKEAGVDSHYGGSHLWLAFPARCDAYPYHIDRDIATGWRERAASGGGRYHKYVKPRKDALGPQPAVQDLAALRSEVVFLVEGWPDAIAVEEHGHRAVAVLSSSSRAAIDAIAASHEVRAVVVMLDNDPDPRKGPGSARKAMKALRARKVTCKEFAWPGDAPKDAGEWNAEAPERLAAALDAAETSALAAADKEDAEAAEGGGDSSSARRDTPAFLGDLEEIRPDEVLTSSMICRWLDGYAPFGSSIAFNETDKVLWKIGPLPWDTSDAKRRFGRQDESYLAGILADLVGKNISPRVLEDALNQFGFCRGRRFNPVRDAIMSLPVVENNAEGGINVYESDRGAYSVQPLMVNPAPLGRVSDDGAGGFLVSHDEGVSWEPVMRLAGSVLAEYLGAPATAFTYEAERRFFGGIVARALYPGCDFQYMLVLHGAQGVGKDTFLAGCALESELFTVLHGKMCSDSVGRIGPGHLVVDVQELDGLKKSSSVEEAKATVSAAKDWVHILYKGDEEVDRCFVLAGSTNDRNVLCDPTGNRRFLIIDCSATEIMSDERREEMWHATRVAIAEVKALHDRMGKDVFLSWLRLPTYALEQMRAEQLGFAEADSVEDSVNSWLDTCGEQRVCLQMAFEEALDIPREDSRRQPRALQRKVATILDARPDLERAGQQRVGKYGRATAWKRRGVR